MKKLLLLVPAAAALALGLAVAREATAGDTPVVSPVLSPGIIRLFTTKVYGKVDISAAKTGEFANMTCEKLSVSASSVAQTPCSPGGGFCVPQSKWTHTQSALTQGATPTTCNYSILVPAGQAFGLGSSTQANYCLGSGFTNVNLKPGPSTGQLTVAVGAAKEADLTVTSFTRECIN
jgi:hypothetical protein